MSLHATAKDRVKLFLEKRGVFLKRDRSLHFGINPWHDLARLGLEESAGTTIFDVGANRGSWTRELLLRFPRVSVHGFEPVPEVFGRLNDELGHLKNVTLNQVAVSDNNAGAVVHIQQNSLLNSIMPSGISGMPPLCNLITPTVSIGEYCFLNDIKRIALLKSDTEGHDLQVLLGAFANEALAIDLVHVEVEFERLSEPHSNFSDIYNLMKLKNFSLVTIYTEYADRNVGFKYGSALFMRRVHDVEHDRL